MSLLLPDKWTAVGDSALTEAVELYSELRDQVSVAQAWAVCRKLFPEASFSRFNLLLDVLYSLSLIDFDGEFIEVRRPDAVAT